MKKIIKKLSAFLVLLSLTLALYSINSFAAGTIISFNKKELTVGDTLSVSVTFDAGQPMYSLGAVVNYDNTILSYESGNASHNAGVLLIAESPNAAKVTYTLTFKALKAGSASITIEDCNAYIQLTPGAPATSSSLTGASASVTITDVALSGNANLKSLSLSAGSLSPRFAASRTSYTATVGFDITSCNVFATAADKGANVQISGNNALSIGKNTRIVTVVAPNGTQKSYTIVINRLTEEETALQNQKPEETPDPLNTIINEATYTIVSDLTNVPLLSGFTASTIEYNGQEIQVAVDEGQNFTLYYLKSATSEELVPYTYNAETKVFEKLKYITIANSSYILVDFPEGFEAPRDSYYPTNTTISGHLVNCYANNDSEMSEYYYFYCFTNGRYGTYRYDTLEGTIQRYPELVLVEETTATDLPKVNDTFLDRFKTLGNNSKLFIIFLAIAILGTIGLIVLIIIKLIRKNDDIQEFDDEVLDELDFDSISIDFQENSDLNIND